MTGFFKVSSRSAEVVIDVLLEVIYRLVKKFNKTFNMMVATILGFLGVPIGVIALLWLLGFLH
jgi:uncharacterized membrane protein